MIRVSAVRAVRVYCKSEDLGIVVYVVVLRLIGHPRPASHRDEACGVSGLSSVGGRGWIVQEIHWAALKTHMRT